MDFSLLQPRSPKRFLRPITAIKSHLAYYAIMTLDPILRFSWILLAVFTHKQHEAAHDDASVAGKSLRRLSPDPLGCSCASVLDSIHGCATGTGTRRRRICGSPTPPMPYDWVYALVASELRRGIVWQIPYKRLLDRKQVGYG